MQKIILLLLLLINLKSFSQTYDFEKKYTETELNSDFDYLIKSLIDTHPNPFTILNKEDFNKKVGFIKSNFKNGLTLKEFYKFIAPLVASLSDGHTSIRFPATKKLLGEESNLFPYSVSFDYKKNVIFLNAYFGENLPIPLNAEILSINGVSTNDIIGKIIENTSGENKAYRFRMGSGFIYFGILLKTYFDFEGNFEVKYKINNKTDVTSITPITYKGFREMVKSNQQKTNPQPTKPFINYALELKPKIKTAIIDFKSFRDEENFKIFLQNSFDTVKKLKIKNLIIDIRENGGGDSSLGDQLLKYIASKAFNQYSKSIVKYSQLQKDFYNENCKEDSTFCETYNYLKEQKNDKIVEFKNEKSDLIQPNEKSNHFDGKIYLLTGLRTFSSAANFAQCFKNYKIGAIIGEETGGWLVCFGDTVQAKLPITEINMSISTKKFYSIGGTDKDMHGTIPDFKIESEKAMEYVLNKIEKNK